MTDLERTAGPRSPDHDDTLAGQIARLDQVEARLLASISSPSPEPAAATLDAAPSDRRRWRRKSRAS